MAANLPIQEIPIKECGEGLVNLAQYDFVLSPEYFEQGLSNDKRIFLRESVAEKLSKAQKGLNGLRLKIWDGFRTREVQRAIHKRFFDELKLKYPDWDDKKIMEHTDFFVANPNDKSVIPNHLTGGAVDLTIVDENGNELNMGTEFDYFGPEGSPYFYEEKKGYEDIINNRKLLIETLFAFDFVVDGDEWWHFDYGNQKWAFQKGDGRHAIYGEAVVLE